MFMNKKTQNIGVLSMFLMTRKFLMLYPNMRVKIGLVMGSAQAAPRPMVPGFGQVFSTLG